MTLPYHFNIVLNFDILLINRKYLFILNFFEKFNLKDFYFLLQVLYLHLLILYLLFLAQLYEVIS